MVKIMMHGCNGVMGQVISKIVEETEGAVMAVSYTHLRAHETDSYLVCRLLLEKKKNLKYIY